MLPGSIPIYNGATGTEAAYLMFIDLYVGNLRESTVNLGSLNNHGAAQIDFTINGLGNNIVAFNAYGWTSCANQGEGINWTNDSTGGAMSTGYKLTATAPVPIPAAFWLLGSGFSGMFFLRRKKIVA
jgi:hypothetical protein